MNMFKLLFYIPFLWLSIAFAEYPIEIKGEWEKGCVEHPGGNIYYYSTKLAIFDEHQVILSWKVYDDQLCTKLIGESWSKWKMTFENTEPDESDLFQVNFKLLFGNKKHCKQTLDILKLTSDRKLYFGKLDADCSGNRATELRDKPYTFSRSLDQTVEDYEKLLKFFWKQ